MCCLLQSEAAAAVGICIETYINWEKDRTRPTAAQFRPLIAFLGYDPSPPPETLAERLDAKRRALGATFDQVAQHLGWDGASLFRYVRGIWRMKPDRQAAMEEFLRSPLTDLDAIRRLPKRRRLGAGKPKATARNKPHFSTI